MSRDEIFSQDQGVQEIARRRSSATSHKQISPHNAEIAEKAHPAYTAAIAMR